MATKERNIQRFCMFQLLFDLRIDSNMAIMQALLKVCQQHDLPVFKPGFHIVVSVVSVVRKKFIGQIELILSPTKSCICCFFCIEHLYGRVPMNFFRTTDTTDTTIWKPGFSLKGNCFDIARHATDERLVSKKAVLPCRWAVKHEQ